MTTVCTVEKLYFTTMVILKLACYEPDVVIFFYFVSLSRDAVKPHWNKLFPHFLIPCYIEVQLEL